MDLSDIQLDQLGLSSRTAERLVGALSRRHGTIVIAGLPRSGRTTTLCACLKYLNRLMFRMEWLGSTLPCLLEGVMQRRFDPTDAAATSALRSALGRLPDALGLDEICGPDVAQLALEAGATDHLVLVCLRAGGATRALSSLVALSADPLLVRDSLTTVLAQRLVRALCRRCRRSYRPDEAEMEALGLPEHWRQDPKLQLHAAVGCPECQGTGYKGWTPLFEVLPMDGAVEDLILGRSTPEEAWHRVGEKWMLRTLHEEGLVKCVRGAIGAADMLAQV